ncbi:hypothetical protein ACKGML_05180 [Klebsiella pneumoniae]
MDGLTLIGLHVVDERHAEANAALNIGGEYPIPAGLLPITTSYMLDWLGVASRTRFFAFRLLSPRVWGGGVIFSGIVEDAWSSIEIAATGISQRSPYSWMT